MRHRAIAAALAAAGVVGAAALGQAPNQGGGAAASAAAQQTRVETADVALVYPDRYAVPVVLEPNRKVYLVAPSDGILNEIVPVGTDVPANRTIAQLDRAELAAKVKVAEAQVNEAKAEAAKAGGGDGGAAQARLDAAKARAELAQLDLNRCTITAPFGGKVISAPMSTGQFITKRDLLAELADYAVMKVLVPVDRTAVKVNSDLELFVEGKPVSGKVMAMVPLPENFAVLRELATPWAGAWVHLNNGSGALEPGMRVRGPNAPTQPITSIPSRALRPSADGSAGSGTVQVVRFNTVLDLAVKVIGDAGYDRTQVSGTFLPTDAVIVESTVPMAAGTVIRFNGEAPVSGAADANRGSLVDVTPPVGGAPPATPPRVAPNGSPNAAAPKVGAGKGATKPSSKPATKPATPKPAGGGQPF